MGDNSLGAVFYTCRSNPCNHDLGFVVVGDEGQYLCADHFLRARPDGGILLYCQQGLPQRMVRAGDIGWMQLDRVRVGKYAWRSLWDDGSSVFSKRDNDGIISSTLSSFTCIS